MREAFRELNITSSFIPSGCTGYVQVLDVAVNKLIKIRIKELSDIHFDTHYDQWNTGKYTVGDRRVLLTQWVGQAWKEFHEENSGTIRRAFRKVGLSLAVDGSEDDELHIEDLPDIEVGDWRHSQIEEVEVDMETETENPEQGGFEYVMGAEMGAEMEDNEDEDKNGDSEMDEEE